MKQKLVEEHTYLQKKDSKLLMNLDCYSSIIMENQKTINLLENTPNQPSNFRAKHWVEINYDLRGTCNTNSRI